MVRVLPCPVAAAAKLLGDRWTLIILRELDQGPRRFTDLERTADGISPSILAARLRDLEHHGVLSRASYRELPPRVEYTLTTMGRDALQVVAAFRWYGNRWLIAESDGASRAS